MKVLTVNFNDQNAPKKFCQSLIETGFAVVESHPIPHTTIDAAFAAWKAFFDSPEKTQFTFNRETQDGYFPFRSENAKDSNIKDLKEFFHVYPHTKLPTSTELATRAVYKALSELAQQLLGWIDDELPTSIKTQLSMPLRDMVLNSSDTLLRPIHYPPLTGGEEPGAIRAAAHEDINLITLLPAATAPGLEVLDTANQWHQVACNPNTIVVNAGDMLQLATGGYFRSTTHRVVNPEGLTAGGARFSMPLFLHPNPTVRLSKEYTAREYLNERLRQIGLK